MEFDAFEVAYRERQERLQMAVEALYLTVEISQNYEQGFQALRFVNEQSLMAQTLARRGAICAAEYLDMLDDIIDHVLVDIERLDTPAVR